MPQVRSPVPRQHLHAHSHLAQSRPQAAGVIAGETIDLAGAIGRHILGNLLPARRLRVSPRAVKRPLSRYAYKSLRVDRRTYKATISIDILMTNPPSP